MQVHRLVAGSLLALTSLAAAQDSQPSAPAPAEQPAATSEAKGILPLENYSGDFWSRSRLTGDWGGPRTHLAEKGMQFQLDFNQTFQSILDGGKDTTTKYEGSLDYIANFDLSRMGVIPGGLIKFRAETRYGDSVNTRAGAIIPVNLDGFLPISSEPDEAIPFTITDLAYFQYFSEHFAAFVGKIDTLDADLNDLASGRGNSQFLNANFVFNPVVTGLVPYSSLGGGVVWMPTHQIMVTTSIIETTEASTNSGFADLNNGLTWSTEADFQYTLGHLPGGANVGFAYAFSNDFLSLNERFVFSPGEGIVAPTKGEAWAAYVSGWQYVWTPEKSDKPIDLLNGEQDRKGIGLFGRLGFADPDVSPVDWSVSGGVGGRGVIPCRDNDTFGLGYYYTKIKEDRLTGILNIDDHAQGFEAYYNLAITPAAHITLDVQAIAPASKNLDTAIILGARLFLNF
jgi:porin